MKGKQMFSCWDSCLKVLAKEPSYEEDQVEFCQNGSLPTSQKQHTFHHVTKIHSVENNSVTLHCL